MTNVEIKPLCAQCAAARAQWLDFRLPLPLGIAHGSGAPYDVSAAGIRDRQRARHEAWVATVRFHRDLIARTCREQLHVDLPGEVAPAVIQLPLLDLVEPRKEAA